MVKVLRKCQLHDVPYSGLLDKRAQVEKEGQRADAWICDLKESNRIEKQSCNERIRYLETESARKSKQVTLALLNARGDKDVGGGDGADCMSDRVATHGNVCVGDNLGI